MHLIPDIRTLQTRCTHVDDEQCERKAELVVRFPHGRRTVAGYCHLHGGTERALQDIENDWNTRAPASVGDAQAVMDAGTMSLSRDFTRVGLRCVPDRTTTQWHVIRFARETGKGLACRTFMSEAEAEAHCDRVRDGLNQVEGVKIRQQTHIDRRHWIVSLGTYGRLEEKAKASTLMEAIDVGLQLWKETYEGEVEAIRAARGGTLEWGVPIPIIEEPSFYTIIDGVERGLPSQNTKEEVND